MSPPQGRFDPICAAAGNNDSRKQFYATISILMSLILIGNFARC